MMAKTAPVLTFQALAPNRVLYSCACSTLRQKHTTTHWNWPPGMGLVQAKLVSKSTYQLLPTLKVRNSLANSGLANTLLTTQMPPASIPAPFIARAQTPRPTASSSSSLSSICQQGVRPLKYVTFWSDVVNICTWQRQTVTRFLFHFRMLFNYIEYLPMSTTIRDTCFLQFWGVFYS